MIEGAENAAHPLAAEPLFSRIGEGLERLGVIFGLDHSEEAGGIPIALDMQLVYLSADSAHGPQSTVGEPGTVLGVCEVRIAGGKMPASLNEKRRDPHRVIAIERPGKADKLTKSTPSLNSCDPE